MTTPLVTIYLLATANPTKELNIMSETQTAVVDPVAAAVAAAQASAAAMLASQAQQVAVQTPQTGGAVAVPAARGKALGFDDIAAGSITVDMWIGVTEHGLTFGKDKVLVMEDVEVLIDTNAVAYSRSIKFGKNPVTYLKTYDGIACVTGGTWDAAVAKAQQQEMGARDFPSADVPMTLVNPVIVKGKEIAAAGTKLGNSLSTTNWANWKSFFESIRALGLEGVVRVKLGSEKRSKNGNDWGVLTFTRTTDG